MIDYHEKEFHNHSIINLHGIAVLDFSDTLVSVVVPGTNGVITGAYTVINDGEREDPTGEDDIAIGGNGEGAHITVMAVHGSIQSANDALVGGLLVMDSVVFSDIQLGEWVSG